MRTLRRNNGHRQAVPARLLSAALIAALRGYRLLLSPLLGPCCRHQPTCSEYMIEALKVHGLMRALRLGGWRLLRCNPWGTSGYDPIPTNFAPD